MPLQNPNLRSIDDAINTASQAAEIAINRAAALMVYGWNTSFRGQDSDFRLD